MKIALIGESAKHETDLVSSLRNSHSFAAFPPRAAHSPDYDEQLADCDVMVSLRLNREPGYEFPPIKLLQVPGAGTDGIDEACLASNTWLCNVYEHEIPIAEFVLASVLDWEIRRAGLTGRMATEKWPALYNNRPLHGEVYGKRLALVGYGRVGRAIAARAAGFGMELAAVEPRQGPGDPDYVRPPEELKEVLARSDYVVVTCPLTDSTRGLLGTDEIASMTRDAVLVNVARGPIVDERALYEALSTHKIGGAILDVWYDYPRSEHDSVNPSRYPLVSLPNVWASPHASAWTKQLLVRRYRLIAENIDRLAENQPLLNVLRTGRPFFVDDEAREGSRG